MAEIKTDWSYPLLETTLDKRLDKPGVAVGFSAELTGVDGRVEGGLRPFPGFKKVHTMTGLVSQTNHSYQSKVVDFKAVDFRISSDYYGYGFVYRVVRPATPAITDVFLDYWNSVTETWTLCTMLMQAVDVDAQFDVEVAGRFVYTFASGRSPAMFYIDATRTKEYICEADAHVASNAATTVFDTSPGNQTLQLGNATGPTVTLNTFLRFNTTAEENKIVESATLNFTVSGNTVASGSRTISMGAVTDPGSTGVPWNETQVTWTKRTSLQNWSTTGGTRQGSPLVTTSVAAGFLGRVALPCKDIVTQCLTNVAQVFGTGAAKVDVALRVDTTGAGVISLAGRLQANTLIQPTLSVTYLDKVFLTPIAVGVNPPTDAIPGPGRQPTLKSPERGTALGSFVTLAASKPASGQVVLLTDNPYTKDVNFPDQVSGLCSGTFSDVFPPVAAPVAPGAASALVFGGSACVDVVGVVTQLLTPANKQTAVSVTPKLDWNTFYETGAAVNSLVRWEVFLVEEGQGTLDTHVVASGLTSTNFEPASLFPQGRLAYGKKYLWKVAAYRTDCTGFYVQSPVGTFTTENKYQARKFEPGDYCFGYVLVDSKTGRRSAFSEIAQVRSEDFLVSRVQSGVTISSKQDQYIGVELVYNSAKYDQLYLYRSVKIQDAGGTLIAGVPFLDGIVTLGDYLTCLNGTGRTFDPASTTTKHAMYFYELEDKQLIYQSPYVDRSIFDEAMPFGGAAIFYQNTMLVSRVVAPPPSTVEEDRVEDVNRGLGEFRWSSLMEISPELYPPYNRYNPTVASNEILTFAKAGSAILGLSRDKVYHIRKSGPYLKITEMHEGYGVVNPKAIDSVGSSAYYVTTHGVKSVDMQGQLDEVRNLNSVFVREWRANLDSVQVSHDPLMNCLFFLNPVKKESFVMWFGSGRTTKIADTNFDHISQGAWPNYYVTAGDATNSLTRRTFFLANNQDTRISGTGFNSFPGPAIYVVDAFQSRVISGGTGSWNGARRITTLDFAGDSRFKASAAWSAGTLSIPLTGATVAAGAWQFCYLYRTYSVQNAPLEGNRALVLWNTTTNVFADPTAPGQSWLTSVVESDVFVVSPVVLEWAGHPLGLVNEQGLKFSSADFFRMKIISSVGAAFSDVSGPPLLDPLTKDLQPLNSFFGLVYKGTGDIVSYSARTLTGDSVLYGSVQDGEGVVYAAFGSDSSDGNYGAKGTSLNPGVRILCPDLDFRFLGCIVRGTITSVERSTNHRGS